MGNKNVAHILVVGVVALFIFCFIGAAHGQQNGLLKGIVIDATTKQPLPGAYIIEKANNSNGTISNADGFFELSLTAGAHALISSFLGMVPDTFSVNISDGSESYHEIRMRPKLNEMDAVVVSAGKYDQKLEEVTVSMQLLKPSLIEGKNTINVKSALEQTPGLIILDEEPQLRGGSGFSFGVGSRVATLIDGLPILTGDAGRTDWSFIPVENIEQIEIIEGASSVLNGSSALSGTINFLTKYPKDSTTTYIRTYTGFYSTPKNDSAKWWNGNANFSGINFSNARKTGRHDLIVGGQFNYDHNYIGPYILDGSLPIEADTIDNSDVANRSGRFNVNYRYRPRKPYGVSFGINGNAMIAHTNFSLIWGNSSDRIYRAFPGTMTITDFKAFYVDPYITYLMSRGGKHTLKSRWYFSDNNNSNGQSNSSNVYLAEYVFSTPIRELGDFTITSGTYMNQTFSKADLYSGSGTPDNRLQNYSVFTQVEKKFFKVLNVVAGARGEYFVLNEKKSSFEPVFRSGVNLQVTKGTNVRASYGQGFRYPTIAEKYIITTTGGIYVFPNPDIQPEKSWSMEAGLKQGFKVNRFMAYADVAFFQQEYHNTIEYIYAIWAPDSAGFKFVNTGDTRVKGFEISLMGEGKINSKMSINLLMGYTYILPQTLEPNKVFATDNPADGILPTPLTYTGTSTDTSDNILKYRFRHLFKADVEIKFSNIAAGMSVRYYSFMENIDKTFYDLDEPYLLPTGIEQYRADNHDGSLVFDARFSYQVRQSLTIGIVINNLANLQYSLRPLKIESPRTIALQLTSRF
ncbi:MAG: TonB-dependent receptor [Bacteroidetes bacterium]|nr:TonB-dependent receptor [Bacteroidota bacterium]